MLPNVLLIDDEARLRELLARLLGLEGFGIEQAASLAAARQILDRQLPDIVLCDVKLPDGSGVDFAGEVKRRFPQLEIALLTAYGNIADGVQAMRLGAFDYLVKGDDNDKIIPMLHRMWENIRLHRRVENLESRLGQSVGFDRMIGAAPAFRQAVELAQKVAPTDTAVLLTGETGTGKEVFAQAIHQASHRAKGPFLALNCSAFGHDILESELFGHRAGAFTGATKDKRGLLDVAAGGTLLLDEVGEMPVDLQAKLLRVLESGEFLPVGDVRPRRADVRLLSATNRDLLKETDAGRFRIDLYYRLAVFQIHLPALRERREDIAALTQHFIGVFARKTGKSLDGFSASFLARLEAHEWRGNIRELRNVVERAVILTTGPRLEVSDLPLEIQAPADPGQGGLSAFSLAAAESLHLRKVLRHTGGNKTEAARLLGIGLTTLYRKIEEYGL